METYSTVRVLLVEDDEDDYFITRAGLSNTEEIVFDLAWTKTYASALEAIKHHQHDVYLIDYRLGERNGLELIRAAIALGCEAPLILLTGAGEHAVDVEAMRVGAADYLDKSQISASLLERSVRHALDRARILAALRASERRFHALFDQTFQLTKLLSPDGTVLEVNQSVLDFAQIAPAEIVGRLLWQFPMYRRSDTPNRLRMAVAEAAAGRLTRCEIDMFGPAETLVTLDLSLKPVRDQSGQVALIIAEGRDISERKRAEQERERLILALQDALVEVKTLSGLLPICASCKKIRDDRGDWIGIEAFIQHRTDTQFSHGICPECARKLYPNLY